eukprot:gene58229-biopygen18372
MVSGPHKLMKQLRELACEMGEHDISPTDVIKVLGVLIDEHMTWEAHNAKATRRANNAIWAVARATKHLGIKERVTLMKSLALPHLDRCQTALAQPSARAEDRVRRSYNKAARTAVWGLKALHRWQAKGAHLDANPDTRLRSEPARQALRWLTWEQRRVAVRAALTAKIFHTKEPEVLRALLPSVTAAVLHDRRLRSHSKGCVVTFAANSAMGNKAFSVWGPQVLNAIAKDAIYDKCPAGAPPDFVSEPAGPRKERRQPSDEFEAERASFYADLRDRFAGQAERLDEDGNVRVWTDGSRCVRNGRNSAGAGVFYGTGHPDNRAIPVPGKQSNARAELFAMLHVLRTEHRPVVVRSDCRYVVDGANSGCEMWRAKAWFQRPLEGKLIANADLWKEVDQRLQLRKE